MALTPIKALLFLAGGTAAAGGVAYVSGVLDPYLGGETPKLVAALVPEKSAAGTKAARLPQPPGANALVPDAPAGEASAAGTPEVLPPSFDVVRVEGDGSIVIAGKAAVGATVEIVTGARVIGNAVAGLDGDFAVVIDEPLKPGGYQIVLRSTAPDNVVATSLETAVVSIPEKSDGQVLALVEKPGEPSKLISVPEPEPTPPLSGDAEAPEAPASTEATSASPEEKLVADRPEASASAEEQPAKKTPTAEQSAAAQSPEPAPIEATPGKPSEQVAAAKPDQGPVELTPSAPTGDPKVAVEAVEIEGRKVFVAGVADAGRKVRIYANDILLGDAEASPNGRFLIETERDLPVGDYIIRADALEPDGVKVAARAAVPFEREEGENLAAVAPPAAPQAGAPATGAGQATAATPNTSAPQPAGPAAEIAAKPSNGADAQATIEAPAPSEAPSGDASASADKSATPDDATLPAAPPTTTDPSPAAPSGAETPPPAAPAATASSAQPSEQPGQSAAAPTGSAPESTPTTPASAETAKPSAGAEVAAAPEATPLAPKLESAPGAVIIRRGDSLWRISRRVYGKGVRYSTIYLANQEQISDPDLIWPGQVFKVPEKTSEGEEADMKAVGEQAVTTTTQ